MKNKNIIYWLILVSVTLAGLWALPALVRKAVHTPDDYPFVYYSSVLKEFGLINYKDKETPMRDLHGNVYTAAQFDSLMPLLNYRQLISDGLLPDSLGGYEITPPLLRSTSVVFRYNPKEVSAPSGGMYILFESMPKRVGLEVPPDVFRLNREIEFIDAETNAIDHEKSDRFRQAFDKAGFVFPAQWSSGNPNPRKAYDEGYFTLDAAGNLFHIKMVNGRPYVRDTGIGRQMDVLSFSMYESANKRFYGFLFDRGGNVHIIESDGEGGYETVRLDIEPIDTSRDQLTVMGNLLYWTATVSTDGGRRYYALDTPTLGKVAEHSIARTPDGWDRASKWLFPVYLTFSHADTAYIVPRLTFTGFHALVANAAAVLALLLLASGSRRRKFTLAAYVLVTGLAGLLAAVILPSFRNRQKQSKQLDMKKLIFMVAALGVLVSCGNNANSRKAKADKAETRTEAAATQVYELEELLAAADGLVGQDVTVRGYVTHTCKHSGKRCFIVGDSQKTTFRIEAKGNIGGFNRELVGSEIAVTGTLQERRLSREYLEQTEKDLNAKKVAEDGSAETCAAELANIGEMKAWMQEHGKDYYSVYYMDGKDYEVVE